MSVKCLWPVSFQDVIALLLMLYALYYCKKHGEDKEKIHAEVSVLREKGFVKVLLDSFWALLTPVIILAAASTAGLLPRQRQRLYPCSMR